MSFKMQAAGEQPNDMTVTVSQGMARMDYGKIMSMVWSPEWWRMIQHEQKMFMEFDKAMMERMRQMMANMPNMPGAPDVAAEMDKFDAETMTFERTGATDTVIGYEVFEVVMTNAEGKQGSMWLSEEAEIGMFEIFSAMATHLSSIAGPMMGGGPGGGNPASKMQGYLGYARMRGLPEGKVLRMNAADGANFEVTGWEFGPFPADFWDAPAGYQKQTMPAFPR
jgi:hypothetical protein